MPPPAETALFCRILHPKKRALLTAYALTGRLLHACASAHTSHVLHYYWLKTDPAYHTAFAEARTIVGDILEEEAVRRAIGEDAPVYDAEGHLIGSSHTHSDTLLIFLLKGAKPATYDPMRKVVHEHRGDLTVTWQARLSRAHTALEERRNGHPHAS